MGVYFIAAIMPFPLGLYFTGATIMPFQLCLYLNIENSLNSLVLLYYAYAIFGSNQRCSLKYMLFKNRKNKHSE